MQQRVEVAQEGFAAQHGGLETGVAHAGGVGVPDFRLEELGEKGKEDVGEESGGLLGLGGGLAGLGGDCGGEEGAGEGGE